MLCVSSLPDCVRVVRRAQSLLSFNTQNPTGCYKFDLANAIDFAIAGRLQLLDRWEIGVAVRQQRMDTSQRGNRSHLRNERYQQLPLGPPLNEWLLPEHGVLELDYLSDQRPPPDAQPVGEKTFWRLMVALQSSECSPVERVVALRSISDSLWFKAVQVRELLGVLHGESAREELVTLLLFRLTDVHNEKLFRVRLGGAAVLQRLRLRLSHLTYFPFMQPEQSEFELDLAFRDQRLAANVLVQLAFREGEKNLRDVSFVWPDGTPDPLQTGVPRAWETFEKMPTGGVLRASYTCSPDNRRVELRAGYLASHGCWRSNVSVEQVVWWAALDEVPADALEFLDFLCSNFVDVCEAFNEMTAGEKKPKLSFSKFEAGVKRLGCRCFEGPTEAQRLQAVFRYIDRNRNGSLSAGEWAVFQVLSREIQLSIREFVHFLRRFFGDSLEEAWEYFSADGKDGKVTKEVWCAKAKEAQYYGPAEPVFRFLDKEQRHALSREEFMLLQRLEQRTERSLSDRTPWARLG